MSAEVSRKNVVVFTGAGMSVESGLQTFRGDGGLWEGHRVEDVATPEAWAKDPVLVLEFYNKRRRKVRAAQPNAAHRALGDLESAYDVRIVTQNVDDLHERAGSMHVLHLHGGTAIGWINTTHQHLCTAAVKHCDPAQACLRPRVPFRPRDDGDVAFQQLLEGHIDQKE